MKQQVVVAKCGSYDKQEIKHAVEKVFRFSGIRKEGFRKILFKPNMLSARLPEDGVTTHPSVVEEAICFFNGCENLIGDSPANSLRPIQDYWKKCGFQKVSQNTGATLVRFSTSFFVETTVGTQVVNVPITSFVKDYSLINIAKLKTHNFTVLTAAVKNLYGLIPGYHKSILHGRFVSPLDFSQFIAEYYHAVSRYVSFNIVDAVVSMEGNGPSSGNLRNTGYLIGGKNAVAVDIVCCWLLGINETKVPYLQAYKKKYGLPEVEINGDELISVKHFVVPGKNFYLFMSNGFLRKCLNLLGKYFNLIPEIKQSKCKKCFACKQVCPVNAISEELKIDRIKCINCLCCFEVCPYRAIKVKKSFLARLLT